LLHLINFDEPFGLSMVEAMACGTPVIAPGAFGAEVVSHGETGFIVSGLDEAVEPSTKLTIWIACAFAVTRSSISVVIA